MTIDSCGATHRGNVRKLNQDNIYVDGMYRIDLSSDNLLLRSRRRRGIHTYGVFDGLGGGEDGEQASLMASQMLKLVDEGHDEKKIKAFFPALRSAIRQNTDDESVNYSGTTAAVLVLDDHTAHACNIGDSRVYLFRGNKLEMMSYDHTREQTLIEKGILQEPDRGHSMFRHELSQFIGSVPDEEIELNEHTASVDCRPGDIFLICSDGLTDAVDNEELGALLESNRDESADHIVLKLVSKALDNNSHDNVSVITVKVK